MTSNITVELTDIEAVKLKLSNGQMILNLQGDEPGINLK